MKRWTRLAAALTVAGSLAVAGCTSAKEADSQSASTSGGSSACATKAKAAVDAARKPSKLVMSDEPVAMASLKGKTVYVILVLTNQWSTAVGEGVKDAASQAGLNAVVWDGKSSVTEWNAGIQQAIAQNASAIALVGIDPSLVSGALKDASAAGIPVLNAISGSSEDTEKPDTVGNFTADYTSDGKNVALWTLADSNCKADTVFFQSEAIPLWVSMGKGAEAVYKEYCPSCKLTIENVDLATLSTELGLKVQTALQKDPNVSYLFPAWDSAVTFVAPAAQQIRPDVKIVSRDGISTSLDSIRSGGSQQVTVATPPESWIGWTLVDQLARMSLGKKISGLVIPTRVIDKTNVGKTNADISPAYGDFSAKYLKLWNLG